MINLELPVYYTNQYKTKKDKTFLVSLNWYRNAFYHEQNKVKQYFHELIAEQLQSQKATPIQGTYKITYEYYYKNSVSDLPNVTPMCSKWVNDTLQDLQLVDNDNVKYLIEETHRAVGYDKINPRCLITIEEIHEEE